MAAPAATSPTALIIISNHSNQYLHSVVRVIQCTICIHYQGGPLSDAVPLHKNEKYFSVIIDNHKI